MSHDGSALYLAAGISIFRIHPEHLGLDTVIEVLPVFPDNLRPHPNGQTYLLGTGVKRAKPFSIAALFEPFPLLRTLLARFLPIHAILELVPPFGGIIELDLDGSEAIVNHWQDNTGLVRHVSGAQCHGEYMYLGTWHEGYLARVNLANLPGFHHS